MGDQPLDTLFLQETYRRLDAGDALARDELIHRASERLYRLASRMLDGFPGVRRWEDSGDVLQTALLKLMRALEQVHPATTRDFMGLAAAQIRRVLLDLARHYQGPAGERRWRDLGGQSRPSESNAFVIEPAESLSAAGPALEAWCEFHQAVENLPVAPREVFSLTYYHGWKQREIAELLQVSERTVRRFWQQASDELRQVLGDRWQVELD
jgi:RNA polymerase sigma-70 factor (ECF subfamily)